MERTSALQVKEDRMRVEDRRGEEIKSISKQGRKGWEV